MYAMPRTPEGSGYTEASVHNPWEEAEEYRTSCERNNQYPLYCFQSVTFLLGRVADGQFSLIQQRSG